MHLLSVGHADHSREYDDKPSRGERKQIFRMGQRKVPRSQTGMPSFQHICAMLPRLICIALEHPLHALLSTICLSQQHLLRRPLSIGWPLVQPLSLHLFYHRSRVLHLQ